MEQVKSPDVDKLNAGEVAERLDDTVVLVVHNKGTTALTVTTVPELALASTELARVGDLDDIRVRAQILEESDGFLSLGVGLDGRLDDEGDLGNLLNAVATSKDEGGERRGGESRNDGEAALVLVDLDMPLAPGLGGREHATATAHVTERSLAGAVSSSTSNTGDTCDGTTSTPGLSTSLVTSLLAHGVRLPLVLGDARWKKFSYLIFGEYHDTHCAPAAQHRA